MNFGPNQPRSQPIVPQGSGTRTLAWLRAWRRSVLKLARMRCAWRHLRPHPSKRSFPVTPLRIY